MPTGKQKQAANGPNRKPSQRSPRKPAARRPKAPPPLARHIADLSLDDYHARPEWSHSQIEVLRASPPLFHGRFISRIFPAPQRDVFDDGSIVHAALTGENEIADLVAVIPPQVLNARGGCSGAAWYEWTEANAGKIQRKAEECDALLKMVASVRSHGKARWLLAAEGYFEYSVVWRDAETGLDLRARPDKVAIISGEAVLADIKTTRATDHHRFAADMARYGYHRQAAWYEDGIRALGYNVPAFCFITVDKTPAHECHVYELVPAAIQLGRSENRQLLRELAHRLQADDWRSRDIDTILELDLPGYKYRDTQ